MAFKLSKRSTSNLEGVHPKLARTVFLALTVYAVHDFGVTCGVRDLATQKRLLSSGATQTLRSKHLIQEDGYSHAVDLVCYDGGVRWEMPYYVQTAEAMRMAARQVGLGLTWGACWSAGDYCESDDDCQDMMEDYITLRRQAGRNPFLDGPHWQIASV
jgi:peptidoglycan L-alanyl-D-glutamate endopeptidase CwlK